MKHILFQLIAIKKNYSRKPLLVIYKPEQNTPKLNIEIVTKINYLHFRNSEQSRHVKKIRKTTSSYNLDNSRQSNIENCNK